MKGRLLWVAISLNRFAFQACLPSRKWECLGWVCLLDRANLAVRGHWWHLCVHFQDVLGQPCRNTLWYRQKWSFLKASDEMDKWLDRREPSSTSLEHSCFLFKNKSPSHVVTSRSCILTSTSYNFPFLQTLGSPFLNKRHGIGGIRVYI